MAWGSPRFHCPIIAISISYGLDKFVRFATEIWGVSPDGKTKDAVAREGLDALEKFIKECGIVTSLEELGATREMLPKIAESSFILENGYKKLTTEGILNILEACF